MRKGIFTILALSSCLAFAGVSAVLLPGSIMDIYGEPNPRTAVSPREALDAVDIHPIGMGADKEMKNMMLVSGEYGIYTNFGEYTSYALPVEFENSLPSTDVLIHSYMVKPKKGRKFVFYPIATAFDEQMNLLQTVLPSNESEIKGNTIKNVLPVPEGTRYLLIHTDPRFVTFDMETGDVKDSDTVSAGLASLGGAVGGLFHGVLFNSQVARGKVGIAPVGVIEVMAVPNQ